LCQFVYIINEQTIIEVTDYFVLLTQDLFMKSTMDSIFKVGFGVDLGTLSDVEESKTFSKAFDEASAQTLYRVFDIFWQIKRFLNIGAEARMKKNVKLLNDFINNVIEKKIKQMYSTQKEEFVSFLLDFVIII
jgi:Cytochrome P450